jgi:phenylacetate-CoA ligase
MSNKIFKFIWHLGVYIRNPALLSIYKELKKSETYSLNTLEKNQFIKIKEILFFAETHSKFYRKLFEEINFNVESDLITIEDFKKIPLLNKTDLIKYNDSIHTDFNFKKLFASETSGTSGQVLKFQKDEYWDSFNRASIMRGYSWYDVNLWDKNGYFWGYNLDSKKRFKIRLLDYLQNRFRIFSYNKKSIKQFVAQLKSATYLSGYSSMIYEVAKIINLEKIDTSNFNLRMIKGTSEKIFDSYQTEVQQAFGLKIISEYGAAESGIIAFECPEGNMHINMEGVYAEEIQGEMVVTNLIAKSFPIIRYKLGDYITLKPKDFECSCGMKHNVIESINGRVGKLVKGVKEVYPSLTFYYVFKNLALVHKLELNYQIHQYELGVLIVLLEQDLKSDQLEKLNEEFKKYFNDDMLIKIKCNSKLHEMNGKLKDFISHHTCPK